MSIEPQREEPGRIKRLGKPERSGAPAYRIERLKGSDRRKVVVLSDMFYGYQIHYDAASKRSEPCYENQSECPGCQKKKPVKRVFYLHVLEAGLRPYFLELTEAAASIAMEILLGEETYRGVMMEFSRTKADNGRIRVAKCEYAERRTNLPPDRDPTPTLHILWNWGRDLPKPGVDQPR
jgi:hypothetical protein